ncbi:FMN-binding negative transcriptional regulator [Marnyiella aurantia]|uniref:FMN-binding negative transcriptional regulator n=1 Tax=Marnyiella aurantia TaxID=2758037 RepID=A0A7D7R7F5_9FLAO|nr:FMN-binding negative transcriptional regulator [Marnyiella aurantia]MBA5247888.1 FMN-binding negative transcriptional regulator [Marnyiella aurantia]QMS99509.1 FMN-binding negative transcriptional regulator [Marnyiella aurantia]
MYIPKIYKSEDRELMKQIISENGFAMLISAKEKLWATHSMFVMNENMEDFYLETHVSRGNHQAKVLKDGDEVLCDFLGANAYISSSWYDHINVSTWNYEAVQVRGTVRLMTDDELYLHLHKLTYKYEKQQRCPMFAEEIGEENIRNEMKGAFGMNIFPTEIHIASKLSQNRKETDFKNIIKELQESPEENSRKVAEKMKNTKSV